MSQKLKGKRRLALWMSASLASGCAPALDQFFTPIHAALNGGDESTPPTPPPVAADPDQTVCDPWGGELPPSGEGHGLKAKLSYLTEGQKPPSGVGGYLKHGTGLDATLYFSDLNVPTRPFDRGFSNQNGGLLTRADGSALYEYFALRFESQLLLPSAGTSQEQRIQLALLSDDGALLKIETGDGFSTLIDNDGDHSTRMTCANTPVTLNSDQAVPIEVSYYQGPRYHIALILLMREWSDDKDFKSGDPLCGAEGNDAFFDSTTDPPTPTGAYESLLKRGWKPVPAEYFYLPGNPPPPNPCHR